jgi:predicted GNAT family acetyltransferase
MAPSPSGRSEPDVHRQGVGAALLDRVAEHVDERGVARQLVCPVVDDADRRAAGVAHPVAPHAVGRERHRRREAVAGHEHRVGQERQQLAQVVDAPLAQVGGGVGDHSRRHRRGGGQLGVDRALAADRDDRDAALRAVGQQRVEAVPGPAPAEQPDEHQRDAVEVEGLGAGGVAEPQGQRGSATARAASRSVSAWTAAAGSRVHPACSARARRAPRGAQARWHRLLETSRRRLARSPAGSSGLRGGEHAPAAAQREADERADGERLAEHEDAEHHGDRGLTKVMTSARLGPPRG